MVDVDAPLVVVVAGLPVFDVPAVGWEVGEVKERDCGGPAVPEGVMLTFEHRKI